jgi:adenosylcobinamide kinase/adenosylcobinamide-phosphate guanylyltransferase
VVASSPRCDREVRCNAGAAPATVSGETAAIATGNLALPPAGEGRAGVREGAAGDDPEPGDLRIARAGTIPRAEEEGPLPLTIVERAGLPPVTLVLGGARSGKSRHAECLVEGAALGGTYCATGEAGDAEMAERIAAHRARRGWFWRTVEEPLALAPVVAAEAARERPLLIDCLTLWLSNQVLAGRPVEEEAEMLCRALRRAEGPVVLVANEVGMGLVPETPLGRRFRDAAGRLNQQVAALADRVVFVAAGLPLVLKGG